MITTLESSAAMPLRHETAPGLIRIAFQTGEREELFVTARQLPGETPVACFARAAQPIADANARPINQMVFHDPAIREAGQMEITRRLGPERWPVTWIVDESGEAPLCGVFLHAIRGAPVQEVRHAGKTRACVMENDAARYAIFAGITPEDAKVSRADQAARVFAIMATVLEEADFGFLDIVRTRYYNEDILGWYDEFNAVRTEYFDKAGVFTHLLPASTGIGARNPEGTAIMAGLVALQAKSDGVETCEIPSPRQGPARAYGSSFSRAVELTFPEHRRVLISGTASIDDKGATIHLGEVNAQIDTTMDVVAAILESRSMTWHNTVRGVVYLRHSHDAEAFLDYCKQKNLPPLPVIMTNDVVCRDDLLFEIEIDAIA